MNKTWAVLIIGLLWLTSQSACSYLKKIPFKRHKPITKITGPVTIDSTSYNTDTVGVTDTMSQQIINGLTSSWLKEANFKTFSSKTKVAFEGFGEKQDLIAHIRIKKDEVIWVSVAAMGGIVQVARLNITNDTIKMINYIDKEATILPMSEAQKLLPVPADFQTLQNLILGNRLHKEGLMVHGYEADDLFMLQINDTIVNQLVGFRKVDSLLTSIQMISSKANDATGFLRLLDYTPINNQPFSMKREIIIESKNKQYFLGLDFVNVDIDKPVDLPFTIPKNFRRK